jgi:hypothetical protein
MGDLGDIYRDMAESVKERDAERLEKNLAVLRANTVPYQYLAPIATVLIRAAGYPKVDFYASKGRWKICSSGRVVFGDAEELLRFLWGKGNKCGIRG